MTAASQIQSLPGRRDQHDVLTIINQIKLTGTFVEIGTYGAHFAYNILAICHPQKLYCVDPYAVYDNFKDAINTHPLDDVYAEAKQRLSPFGDTVEFLRMFSDEAVKRFDDSSLDFVYIDGNHAYKYVMKDLEGWYPKLRDGGLLCCDDAVDGEDDSQRNDEGDIVRVWSRNAAGEPESWGHYGVVKAVKEFSGKYGLKLYQTGTQCMIINGRDITIG